MWPRTWAEVVALVIPYRDSAEAYGLAALVGAGMWLATYLATRIALRVAARIAGALGADELVILTNVPGLLRDVSDRSSVVAQATLDEAEGLAAGRMKKKILAAREALDAGVAHVAIRGTGSAGTRIIA